MILPNAVAVSLQVIMLVAAGDRVPRFSVEPVCKGIAEQGGARQIFLATWIHFRPRTGGAFAVLATRMARRLYCNPHTDSDDC